MNCSLSVIIPVYNREKFIVRCVESVLKQKGSDDFQIILVDDGSTDGSPAICDDLSSKYSNVHAFHQKNAGVSAARNLGIEKSAGEWISFVDCDDYLLDGFYDEMLSGETADMICCGYTGNKIESDRLCSSFDENIYTQKDFNKILYPVMSDGYSFFQCWNKIYRRKIIIENRLFFPSGVKYGEDMMFVYNYVRYIETFKFVNKKLYYYYVSEGNTTNIVKKGYEAYESNYLFLTEYFKNVGFYADNLKQDYIYKAIGAIYTAAASLDVFTAYKYINHILKDTIFYKEYAENRIYGNSSGINGYLDRFIIKKNALFIVAAVRCTELKSKHLQNKENKND